MADVPARPPLDWSGAAPFPFTRESTIRIDREGRFWHEGVAVDHPKLAAAMATWISRHPIDSRYVLENGYDWCWIQVDDTPFVVRSVKVELAAGAAQRENALIAVLSDGTEERLAPEALVVDAQGDIRCEVKRDAKGGPYPARFDRHALASFGDRLREDGGDYVLTLPDREVHLRRG